MEQVRAAGVSSAVRLLAVAAAAAFSASCVFQSPDTSRPANPSFEQQTPAGEIDWSANGRDVHGTRYSPASNITRENVTRLQVAWTYRTGETKARYATDKAASFEATPLVVDGTMYVGTPLGRVIALDPLTGQERWCSIRNFAGMCNTAISQVAVSPPGWTHQGRLEAPVAAALLWRPPTRSSTPNHPA